VRGHRFQRRFIRPGPDRQCKGKGTAGSYFAFDPDPAAVQLDKFSGQCQSQTGPLLQFRRSRPGLLEFVKDAGLVLGRDTDAGIANGYPYFTLFALGADIDLAAIRCKLHGIGKQIDNDLLDHALVGFNGTHCRIQLELEGNAVASGAVVHHPQAILEDIRQRKLGPLQDHMPGFHF
jgi:hypothetical protein